MTRRWTWLAVAAAFVSLGAGRRKSKPSDSRSPSRVGAPFEMPDLSKAPGLIGPVTDVMTFYADLFLAMHQGALRNAGDHFHFASPITSSWADGAIVVLGEDHIDFDITLTAVDAASGVARLPADWMRKPVAETPNNWVQVRKTATGLVASVRKETFDVTLDVAISSGEILSATMENPVTKVTRACSDASLTQCGDAQPSPVLRRIARSGSIATRDIPSAGELRAPV